MSLEVKITKQVVEKKFAELLVNGVSKGKREINGGPSLLEFAQSAAEEFGVSSFTITLDSRPATVAQAAAPVPSEAKVNVQAKDARGSKKTEAHDEHAQAAATSEGMPEAAVSEPATTTQGESAAPATTEAPAVSEPVQASGDGNTGNDPGDEANGNKA